MVVAKIRIKRGISIKIIFVSIFLFLLTIYYICGIINLPFKRILDKEENFNEICRNR